MITKLVESNGSRPPIRQEVFGNLFWKNRHGDSPRKKRHQDWPRRRWLVIYDGDCGFCNRAKGWIERIDLEGLLDWRTFQSGAGRAHGISDAEASERLYVIAGSPIYSGFRAFRTMLLFNPLRYFAMAILIAAPPGDAALYRRIVVAGLLAFFLPPFAPVGEWVYRIIARNRYRGSRPTAPARLR